MLWPAPIEFLIYKQKDSHMLLGGFRSKIEQMRSMLLAKMPWLPFKGMFINMLVDYLLTKVNTLFAAYTKLGPNGLHDFIDLAIDMAEGQLQLPWYAKPFANMLLEQSRTWLHANEEFLKDRIGETV